MIFEDGGDFVIHIDELQAYLIDEKSRRIEKLEDKVEMLDAEKLLLKEDVDFLTERWKEQKCTNDKQGKRITTLESDGEVAQNDIDSLKERNVSLQKDVGILMKQMSLLLKMQDTSDELKRKGGDIRQCS